MVKTGQTIRYHRNRVGVIRCIDLREEDGRYELTVKNNDDGTIVKLLEGDDEWEILGGDVHTKRIRDVISW